MKRALAVCVALVVVMGLLIPYGGAGVRASQGLASADLPLEQTAAFTFAVLGDYGMGNVAETSVANLIKSWNPAIIVTTGDGYRNEAGGTGSEKYDNSTGKDYCAYLKGITTSGTNCPSSGAGGNAFFPTLGNHDYTDAGTTNNLPTTYTDYFNLTSNNLPSSSSTNNERYYDFVQGPVHFFMLNSNNGAGQEPDGTNGNSAQALWLQNGLKASTSVWNIVLFHHPPYSSGSHGSNTWMQWPFAQWGADVVIAGHDHDYERIVRDGIVYFVNGTGGAPPYTCGSPVAGSQVCLGGSSDYGAQKVTATDTSLDLEFYTIDNILRDSYHLSATPPGYLHVGDLDGNRSTNRSGKWNATVTIAVHDDGEGPVSGATVGGTWSSGAKGSSSCVTDASGQCTVTKSGLSRAVSSVTFTVTSVVLTDYTYQPDSNHDPDGDSTGTRIVVSRQ